MKTVIVGNHAAGLSAAETLRKGDRSCDITVISRENVPPYSRCLIPYLVSGEKKVDDILFRPRDFYKENNIKTMLGAEVVRVLDKDRQVLLADGKKVDFNFLIIATGGTPTVPAIPGIKSAGVFGFRTLHDAEGIMAYCDKVESAVVLGGGLIGLKAAAALHERGKQVRVFVDSPSILSQIIGSEDAKVVEKYLAKKGLEIRIKTSPARILGNGKVEGIETTEGETVSCQMVVVGKGVKANRDIANGTGIETNYGIVVDEHCRTSVPYIYAAGDVAQSQDNVRKERWMNALWPLAVEEGRVAAENVLGTKASLRERTSMNSLVIEDLPLISCGITGAREKVEGSEEVTIKGPGRWKHRRFILKNNVLIGFVLVGDVVHAGVLTSLVRKGINVEEIKERLLSGKFDFASILPLVRKNSERFYEKEYKEVLAFF